MSTRNGVCKRCYNTGVYYVPLGPNGALLRAEVCGCQKEKK